MKKYWREILIGVFMLLAGLFLVLYINAYQGKSYQTSIDSLLVVNKSLNEKVEKLSDSTEGVIRAKDDTNKQLIRSLESITRKYIALRGREPVHDTVVKTDVVYQGQECIEKLPILEAQVTLCESQKEDLRNLLRIRSDQNVALQGQFDRAIVITKEQEKQNRSLDRKRKINKIWAVGGSVTALGLLIALIATN